MKNTKETTNKKQTKKIQKPKYVVNLSDACGELDATLRFALCKYNNKIDNFTVSDVWALKEYIKILSMPIAIKELINSDEISLIGCGEFCPVGPLSYCFIKVAPAKKPNIFRRFWNWITRKK